MAGQLPPLRAIQAFEALGRLGSINSAAQELGVTPGAVSQQIRLLEETVGLTLVVKDGRGVALTPQARVYLEFVSQGFEKLRLARDYLEAQRNGAEITISGMPTLMLKWLGPHLHRFQAETPEISVRLEATHREPDPKMLDQMFRLTYGQAANRYSHSRALFTDICFPVCSPDFLARHPEAQDPVRLPHLPLVDVDWGAAYADVPRWKDWFAHFGLADVAPRPIGIYSLSSLALEAAAGGQGIALAQASFAETDMRLGRLIRLSDRSLPLPEAYYVCWGLQTLSHQVARDFLNWLMQVSRPNRTLND
ncbi:MAG: LysR substrate-binding domain-containing protein [Alphaproteobacteria bacterium]